MAVDAYVYFEDYKGQFLLSESQVQSRTGTVKDELYTKFNFNTAATAKSGQAGQQSARASGLFEIEDFSFDIEQTLNIGSQSTGAGAGKVTFNPFSITRKIDRSSPIMFQNACSGTPFKQVCVGLRKSAGGEQSGIIYLVFVFRLVAVKTIGWSYDDEAPKETTTFEYGGLQVHYAPQKPDGTLDAIVAGGWNRVRNIKEDNFADAPIT